MLLSVESVPQFGGDPKVLSRDESFVNCLFDSFSDLNLVSIIACWVEASIAGLDGLVDGFSAFVLGDFPEAKAELGHLSASRQSKVWVSSVLIFLFLNIHFFYFLKFLKELLGVVCVISKDRLGWSKETILIERVFIFFNSFEHVFNQCENWVPTVWFNLKFHSTVNTSKHEALELSFGDLFETFTGCIIEICKFLAHGHTWNAVLLH